MRLVDGDEVVVLVYDIECGHAGAKLGERKVGVDVQIYLMSVMNPDATTLLWSYVFIPSNNQ